MLGPLSLDFPYEVVEYERPRVLVFAGSTRCFTYRERVTFAPDGPGATIEWASAMDLGSLLALGNPILSLLYQHIGDDAIGGIARVLEACAR